MPHPARPTLRSFKSGARERAAQGKALRANAARADHAEFRPEQRRFDPIALLDAIAKRRLQYLVPLRNARMVDTPFTYFRGAAVAMAADLAETPATGIRVQACGDAHCLNFGGFASPERNLLFDVNDFDETLPGPWEWDLKRLVTSITIAGHANELSARAVREASLETARAYRARMFELAALPALDVWYTRLDATDILNDAKSFRARHRRSKISDQVATDSIREAVEKLTDGSGRARRFREDPPALFHSTATDRAGFDIAQIIDEYKETLAPDIRTLLDRYVMIDSAIKVVGVGSVGTRCAIALFAADDHDPLLLQIKQALPSALSGYAPASLFANEGERVVRGQRLMQAASDAFLGWASSGDNDFYVRQFKDMKASANLDGVDSGQLRVYGQYCAFALAAGHARSGDAATIAGYLGKSAEMDHAVVAFAEAYADQNERDYVRFRARVEKEDPVAVR